MPRSPQRPSRRGLLLRAGSAVLAVAVLLAACVGTRGSGRVMSEDRAVAGFSSVELAGTGDVRIDATGSETLTIEAEDNILPLLTSDVRDGRLVLGVRDRASIAPTRPIVYHLSVRQLTGLLVSGSGQVSASRVAADRLAVDLSGSGTITVSGTAADQQVDISGSGVYRADALAGRTATVSVSGSGRATVQVSERLHAEVSGSGTVVYLGDAQVSTDISGSGEVVRG